MYHSPRVALVAMVLVAACGSSYNSGTGAAGSAASVPSSAAPGRYGGAARPSATGSASSPGTSATISIRSTTLGNVLVDDKGLTLYAFTKDTAGQPSTCTGACATAWPALAAEAPTAGAGVDAGKLTVVARDDGTKQVAYAGHQLYRYANDAKPGDVTGQNSNGVWFAVDPAGSLIGT